MTEGIITLVEYAGWKIRRFDCPEDSRPDYRQQYLIERTDGGSSGTGWMSKKEYRVFKAILRMADEKECEVNE